MKDISFFLGANTYRGFYSLYEEYLKSCKGDSVWILKGGAGCGKSSFMRTVGNCASAAGYPVRRILCSGDPSSLDGIHIPDLGIVMIDGTAPHVLEPPLVGDRGFYLDLSRFYRPGVPDLREMEETYREHYRRAYCWLAAAGEAENSLRLPAETETVIRRRAAALIGRELRTKSRTPGKTRRVFTDAFTGEGMVSLPETKAVLVQRQIGIRGICGAEHVFLAAAADAAVSKGWDAVLAPSPLQPNKLAHLFVPENGLGIGVGEGDRYIHLDNLIYRMAGKEEAARIRDTESMRLALLTKGRKELALARFHHDRLEAAVNPYVDFAGVQEAAKAFAEKMLKTAPSPAAETCSVSQSVALVSPGRT